MYIFGAYTMLTMTATNARTHFFEILKNATQAHETSDSNPYGRRSVNVER